MMVTRKRSSITTKRAAMEYNNIEVRGIANRIAPSVVQPMRVSTQHTPLSDLQAT